MHYLKRSQYVFKTGLCVKTETVATFHTSSPSTPLFRICLRYPGLNHPRHALQNGNPEEGVTKDVMPQYQNIINMEKSQQKESIICRICKEKDGHIDMRFYLIGERKKARRRKENILTSFKRPKWPINKKERKWLMQRQHLLIWFIIA